MNEVALFGEKTVTSDYEVSEIKVSENNGVQTISARDLHERLESNERFSKWWERFASYGFVENVDFMRGRTKKYAPKNQYTSKMQEVELDDYAITIEMAKQICMLQRSEKGRQYREYFLRLEMAWNTPEAVMARALQVANRTLENARKQIADMKPKADFYDAVTQSNDTIDMKEVAKTLNIKGLGRNNLFEFLREKKILDKNNLPYQSYVNQGYFKVVESHYEYPQGCINVNQKTVVFQKGLDFIRRTIKKECK